MRTFLPRGGPELARSIRRSSDGMARVHLSDFTVRKSAMEHAIKVWMILLYVTVRIYTLFHLRNRCSAVAWSAGEPAKKSKWAPRIGREDLDGKDDLQETRVTGQ